MSSEDPFLSCGLGHDRVFCTNLCNLVVLCFVPAPTSAYKSYFPVNAVIMVFMNEDFPVPRQPKKSIFFGSLRALTFSFSSFQTSSFIFIVFVISSAVTQNIKDTARHLKINRKVYS